MKRFNIVIASILFAYAGAAASAGGEEGLDQSGANVHDLTSVQRGAALFANYCHSCHSAEFMRYQRLSMDLGIPADEVERNLLFGDQDLTDYMKAVMPEESEQWFGKKPPDLSLTARARGADWIYTFLKSFYLTEDGWNNQVLANASMPNVLWELQGIQRPVMESFRDASGQERMRLAELQLDEAGSMTPAEYERTIRDLTAFMIYLAEPAVIKRETMGIWVLLFLVIFTFLAWLLYKEYWRDVKK